MSQAATSAGTTAMTVVRQDEVELRDDPIRPEWVLEGEPRARVSVWAESADRTTSHWVWDCTAGRFRWYYELDETIHVVDGSVTIIAGGSVQSTDSDEQVTLEVGDSAYFPAGTWSEWTVERYVRKHAVVRVPVPRALEYAVNGFGRRMHRLRGAAVR